MVKVHLPNGEDQIHQSNEESILDAPAHDGLLKSQSVMLDYFGRFIPDDAEARLRAAGIGLTGMDCVMLVTGMRVFEGYPEMHATGDRIETEERIAALADELGKLVEKAHTDYGWRHVWGEVDPDDEQPEPDGSVEVSEFLEQLDMIRQSAQQAVYWLHVGRQSPRLPQSNRADRTRYFYWLLLLAFWTRRLGREIKTSNGSDRDPYGPLVYFIQAFSAGGMNERELSGDTVRQWIRRNAHRVEDVIDFMPDWGKS